MTEQKLEDETHEHDHDHGHDHDHAGCAHNFEADLNELGPCKQLLRVSYPADAVREAVDKEFNRLRKGAHLKGFRKGKAPRKHLERLYGKDVRNFVQSSLIEESVNHTIEHEGFELLSQPEPTDIKFDPATGLSFEVTLMLRPSVEFPDVEAEPLKVEVERVNVTDAEVEEALNNLNEERGDTESLGDDATVEEKDTVVCDVEVWLASELEAFDAKSESDEAPDMDPLAEIEDVEIKVGASETQLIAGIVVRDIDDDLLGHQIGDICDIDVVLPTDYEKMEGRGEAAVLRLDILEIKRVAKLEVDEGLAREHGFDSVDELRSDVRNKLLDSKQQQQESAIRDEMVLEVLRRIGDLELPHDIVESETQKKRQQFARRCAMMGMSEEQMLKELQDKDDELRVETLNELKRFFVLDAWSKKAKIEVSSEEVHRAVQSLASGMDMTLPELLERLEASGQLHELRWSIQETKALDALKKHTEVSERG